MKRLLFVLSLAAVTFTGCLDMTTTSKMVDNRDNVAKDGAKRPPAVQPDEITDANAHAKAMALKAEMDFDERNVP